MDFCVLLTKLAASTQFLLDDFCLFSTGYEN